MTTSCSCLKWSSLAVAISNLSLGLYIFIEGSLLLKKYVDTKGVNVGFMVVYFQIASFLIFVGMLLLIGVIQGREKYISLYLLLSSLLWFIITTLAVSYMSFYNKASMTAAMFPTQPTTAKPVTEVIISTENLTLGTTVEPPKETVPVGKAVGFSIGLVLIWCGQLAVYKFHDNVIEKHVINVGESYVSSAIHHDDN